ncbi:MAG TPA: hypothetical protein VF136_07770, partial [Methylomirabilota bacterium]
MSDGRPGTTPRRGFWRRAMRGVVVLCLLLVVLGAVLHLPPVQRRLVGAVFTRLQDRLGLTVGFEDFRFNLVTRTVTIDRLQVGVPGAPAPLVVAPRVHVSFPLAAFQGDADGLDVELVDAQVALVRENDRWTTMPARWFDRSDDDGGGGGGVPAFARLAFRNLSVRYEDRDAGFRADTTGFTADLRPSITAARLAGDIQPGAVTRIGWGDRGTTATFEGGRMFFSPDGAGVDALRLSLPEGTVDADVRFAFGEDPAISLTADANLRAEALDRWTDVLEPAAGPLRVRLTMPATGGEGLADLQVRSPGFSWRGFEISALDGAGVLATTHVTFETLGLNVGGGRIQGEARLAWSDRMASRATAAGTNLDAGALFRVFDVDAMRLLAPASLVSGRFSGSWPSWDADRLSGSLQSAWRARPSGLTAGERWWFDGRLDVRFREGPWVLSVDQRMSGALDLDGTVQIASDRTRDFGDWGLGGRLALAGSTPATLGAAASLFDTTVPVDLEAASGTLTGQASLDGRLGAPLADVDLVSTLAWPDQPEIATATSARVGADRIVVHRFDAESGPSALTAEAEIDLDADRIAGRFEGRRVAVEAWTRRFGWGTPIEAELDAAGTLEGPLDAPVVSAQVETGPLALAGQSFPGGLSADVRYDTRSLAAGQIRLAQPDGAVTGRAEWTRDGGQVAASLQLANLAVGSDVPGLTGRAAGQPVRLEAHVDGSATVSGTLDRPAVTARLEAPALMLDDRSLGAVSAVIETAE